MNLRRSMALGFVMTTLTALFGTVEVARATLYGYSVQRTSHYSFTSTPTGALTVGPLFALSSSSATQVGGAVPPGFDAHAGTYDVSESYVGFLGGKPPENTWTPTGTGLLDYARGDALITPPTLPIIGFTTNNVAELNLASPSGIAAASGSWSVSASLTLSATASITLAFDYLNELTILNSTPGGVVQAAYTYVWTIRDSAGSVVYTSAPIDVNKSVSLTSPGSISNPDGGSLSITSIALAPGTYTGTIAGTETVFAATSVPEPTTLALLAMGGAGLFGLRYRRSRRG